MRQKPGPKPLDAGGERYPHYFKPGQSGNPGGRPKRTEEQRTFEQMVRSATPKAVEVLQRCLDDPKAAWSDRMKASLALISYAEGTPVNRMMLSQVQTPNEPEALSLPDLRAWAASQMAETRLIEGECSDV
jgi:uncharacterized protein DUF5681